MKLYFPVKYITVSQPFKDSHKGVDLGWNSKHGGKNVPIYAPADGTVIELKNDYNKTDTTGNSYGNYIKIDHGSGYVTLSAHLKYNSAKVKKGDKVKKGQIIAQMGNTGYSKGNHDHFEVRIKGKKVDPLKYAYLDKDTIVGEDTAKLYKFLKEAETDKNEVENLKKEITTLRNENTSLKAQVEALQEALDNSIDNTPKFTFKVLKNGTYKIKLNKGETLYIK